MTVRLLLTALVVTQGAATLWIDLNRTHVTNSLWPGHARFHLAWQVSTTLLLSVLASWLIWVRQDDPAFFYLAAALAASPMLGFLLAQAARRSYGGTLGDANGIAPFSFRWGQRTFRVDGNAAAVYLALPVLLGLVVWFHQAAAHRR